jgi:hypothetical protein
VAATDINDERTSYSNYGSSVDIAAPGGDGNDQSQWILTTYLTNQFLYAYTTGTSFSAPQVSAAVSLLLSQNESLSPDEIENILISSADPISTDQPIGRRLNVHQALLSLLTPTSTPPPSPTNTPTPNPTPTATSQNFTCTMVIGYSQVGLTGNNGWYGEGWYVAPNNTFNFENIVDDNSWQLLWDSGHGVDQWQDPSASGWIKWANEQIDSPCTSNSNSPDRILLSVTGPYGTDGNLWVSNTKAAINTIVQQIPSLQQLVLEPVVGGPNHQTCPCNPDPNAIMGCGCDTCDGINVRASQQHPYIDNAINQIVMEYQAGTYNPGPQLVIGYSPEVGICNHYFDGIGHLTTQGAEAVGVSIGQYYTGQVLTPTPTPTSQPPTPTSVPPTPTPTPTSQPPTPTPTPTCTSPPGDGNGDCSVNGVDYVIWLVNYGRKCPDILCPDGSLEPKDGDYFDDDQVNGVDYVVWLTNYTG